ncbi:hypothetical protein K503DRAFT_395916 [Rhizopogon vinicolor AM-OR11-026]|uniref:Uncharacterized protein n=1 Tax=Rhizopogon vinicolor AM-OR11-026 TaxID=1314800 RepID=A0A1B7NBL4_9AGAM|nr:hypothetical protein K503DRAFT_395916 [Rhizopogon vinicolor AM-OR11-026]
MFKRVDKKRKKREEEEELGLDEDMKAIMGLNDTDSDESASESGSNSDGDSDAEQSGEEDLEEAGDETGDETEDADASEDDEPPISLSEALRDPVYVVSLEPDVRACMLCKGKVIKSTPMSQVHKTSTAHKRRFERFKSLAAKSDQDSDAWQIARAIQQEGSTQNRPDAESGMSKRALKRQNKYRLERSERFTNSFVRRQRQNRLPRKLRNLRMQA